MHLFFLKSNRRKLFPVIMLIMVLTNSIVATELEYAYMHFPPYQYNKELSTPDNPGINLEIIDKIKPYLGFKLTYDSYPPSRIFELIKDGKIDLFAIVNYIAEKYEETMLCTCEPIITVQPTLFQNIDKELELTDYKKDLKGKFILVPKESLFFFQSIIPKGNKLEGTSLPKLLVRMFMKQRDSYIIDFWARTGSELQKAKLSFKYREYPLAKIPIVTCIRRNIPNSKLKLEIFHNKILEFSQSEAAKLIYKKYGFQPNYSTPSYKPFFKKTKYDSK